MKKSEFTIKRLGALAIALWAACVFVVDSRRVRRCTSYNDLATITESLVNITGGPLASPVDDLRGF